MAITTTFLGSVNPKNDGNSATTISSVTVPRGELLLVLVGADAASSSVTFNGTACTLDVSQLFLTHCQVEIWSFFNNTAGDITGNVVRNGVGTEARAVQAFSINGVFAFDQSAKATGTSTSPASGSTPTTINDNEFVICASVTEGPTGDTPGSWTSPFTGARRNGTTGSTANTNITLASGNVIASSKSTFNGAKTGITSRDWAVATATYRGGDSRTPATVSATLSVAAPTINIGKVTVTPATVTENLSVASPTVNRFLTVTPAVLSAVLSVAAPSVLRSITLTPAPVSCSLSVAAPTVQRTRAVTPAPVVLELSVSAPTVNRLRSATPTPVTCVLAVASPTVLRLRTVATAPITLTLSLAAPTARAVYRFTPGPVSLVLSVASIQGFPITVTPGAAALALSLAAPTSRMLPSQTTMAPIHVFVDLGPHIVSCCPLYTSFVNFDDR